jgi:hypothetical protein
MPLAPFIDHDVYMSLSTFSRALFFSGRFKYLILSHFLSRLEVTRRLIKMVSRKTNSITSATEGDPIVLLASYFCHFVVLEIPKLY